jgi:hypothetical protein
MRRVHIRAGSERAVACLMRDLYVYAPRSSRSAVAVELDGTSQTELLALLTAVETCLAANDIDAVRIAVDGKSYMMSPRLDRRSFSRSHD